MFIFNNKNLGKLCCYLEDWRLKFKLYKAIEYGFFLTQIFPYKDRIVPFTGKYQSEKTLILTFLDSLLKDHMKNEFEEVRGPSSPHHFNKKKKNFVVYWFNRHLECFLHNLFLKLQRHTRFPRKMNLLSIPTCFCNSTQSLKEVLQV